MKFTIFDRSWIQSIQFLNLQNISGNIWDLILRKQNVISNVTRTDYPLVKEDSHHPSIEFIVNFSTTCMGSNVYIKYYYETMENQWNLGWIGLYWIAVFLSNCNTESNSIKFYLTKLKDLNG